MTSVARSHAEAGSRLAELLAALSVATDLGHGLPAESAVRSCLLATRLADLLGLGAEAQGDVYYTALLLHIGCTAYAHEEAFLFGGDEIAARATIAAADMGDPRDLLAFALRMARGRGWAGQVSSAAVMLPRAARAMHDLATSVCEVGAAMASRLGLRASVARALQQVYERWDGRGAPNKMRGEDIGQAIRFAQVSTQALAVAGAAGLEQAPAIIARRGGRGLDPSIAEAFRIHGRGLLEECVQSDAWQLALDAEPRPRTSIAPRDVDGVAEAFADMVDLKTPFTRGHSRSVADLVARAATLTRLEGENAAMTRRAALLHDLGSVAVTNGIWEKNGPLTAADWEKVRLHAYHTERILQRSPSLAPLAVPAGMHHERADGSGYHRGAAGAAIPLEARLIAAADCYQALTEERPHRPALPPEAAAEVLLAEAKAGRLDEDAARAVAAAAGQRPAPKRRPLPAGLTDREAEVLRLLARGATYRDVGRRLVISPRTAAHHVQHIYNKIGVSSRAAAAMFAMQHHLLSDEPTAPV